MTYFPSSLHTCPLLLKSQMGFAGASVVGMLVGLSLGARPDARSTREVEPQRSTLVWNRPSRTRMACTLRNLALLPGRLLLLSWLSYSSGSCRKAPLTLLCSPEKCIGHGSSTGFDGSLCYKHHGLTIQSPSEMLSISFTHTHRHLFTHAHTHTQIHTHTDTHTHT